MYDIVDAIVEDNIIAARHLLDNGDRAQLTGVRSAEMARLMIKNGAEECWIRGIDCTNNNELLYVLVMHGCWFTNSVVEKIAATDNAVGLEILAMLADFCFSKDIMTVAIVNNSVNTVRYLKKVMPLRMETEVTALMHGNIDIIRLVKARPDADIACTTPEMMYYYLEMDFKVTREYAEKCLFYPEVIRVQLPHLSDADIKYLRGEAEKYVYSSLITLGGSYANIC